MLVLTRRKEESIAIGDSIVITVLAVEGDRVKIGISAPREMPILRGEIYQAIKAQNQIEAQLSQSPESAASNTGAFQALRQFLVADQNPYTDQNPVSGLEPEGVLHPLPSPASGRGAGGEGASGRGAGGEAHGND